MADSPEPETKPIRPWSEPADTHPDAYRRYIERLAAMTPSERVARVFRLREFVAQVREAAKRAQ